MAKYEVCKSTQQVIIVKSEEGYYYTRSVGGRPKPQTLEFDNRKEATEYSSRRQTHIEEMLKTG